MEKAQGKPKVILEARVIRADGKVEELGEIASTEKGTIRIGEALKKLLGKKK